MGIITVGFIALYMLLSCNSGDPKRHKENIKSDESKSQRAIKSEDLKTVQLAEQADAMYSRGLMCAKGEGVVQDYREAVKWCTEAAQQGDAKAQFFLGEMYEKGEGVVQDYVTAHTWFNLTAAQAGSLNIVPVGEQDWCRLAREARDHLAKRMTLAQITKAQQLAREWKPAKTTQ